MIDTLALALGHGLMAIAMLRLVSRAGLDEDPLLGELAAEASSKRKAASAARRAKGDVEGEGEREREAAE
jgi:hypothetical protein